MHFHQLQKKILITTCLVIATIYLIQPQNRLVFNHVYYYLNPQMSIQCYHTKSDTLPDISDDEPPLDRTIFFHETSCNSHFNGKIVVGARQACAVESAARLHPHYEVRLLFASPGTLKLEGTPSDRLLTAILTYPNVKLNHLNYERYTRATAIEGLYKDGRVEVSEFAQSHASDVLRYLTLWKYGGIYLDLDVVVINNLEPLGLNFAGSESQENIAAGVLSFSRQGHGHLFAQCCLDDLSRNFKGYDWGNNGPGVITRLLKDICGVETAEKMQRKSCQGFKVYPEEAFYPIPWLDWRMYFEENMGRKVLNISKNSYVVHVWNKHSAGTKVKVRGGSAYAILARRFCPRVAEELGEYF